jgi:hypothetical protein
MRAGDLSDLPNPFATPQRVSRPINRKPLITSLKFLALVAIGFSVTLIAGSQSRRWLLHRLTADFGTLTSTEKKQRLIKISELGETAIDPLVHSLADQNIDVARTGYDLLRQAQNEWTTLPAEEITSRHRVLIDSLGEVAVHIPDDRTGWASGLLQQTMMHAVDRSDPDSRVLYEQANEALDQFTLVNRAGPSVLENDPADPLAPTRLSVRAQPLPVDAIDAGEAWTDWPPASEATGVEDTMRPVIDPPTAVATDPPTVYRSSLTPLQAVQPGEAVILQDLDESRETSFELDDIRPVTHLLESPMETFDDSSIIHWLGSPHQVLREKAKLELIRRGYGGGQIALATQIASGDVAARKGLVDAIARSESMDPRPWLLFLLDDESREVKLRAISVLATMNDPAIAAELRARLVDQSDPIIAARLRRVLDVR